MVQKKPLGVIIGSGVAAAILVLVLTQPMAVKDISHIIPDEVEKTTPPTPEPAQKLVSDESISDKYKINTECEMIYGLSKGIYPDGTRLPHITISNLIAKYPEALAPWKGILEDNQSRTEFFKKPPTPEFIDAMTSSIMNYSSINPGLKPIVALMLESNGKQKLQQDYLAYGCKPYFEQRSKQP